MIDDVSCLLEILDTASNGDYDQLRAQWVRDADAALVLFSLTARASFDNISSHFNVIDKALQENWFNFFPVFLVGTKCDLEGLRQVGNEEAAIAAQNYNTSYYGTSAKSRINVEEVFYDAVRACRTREAVVYNNNSHSKGGKSRKCTIL